MNSRDAAYEEAVKAALEASRREASGEKEDPPAPAEGERKRRRPESDEGDQQEPKKGKKKKDDDAGAGESALRGSVADSQNQSLRQHHRPSLSIPISTPTDPKASALALPHRHYAREGHRSRLARRQRTTMAHGVLVRLPATSPASRTLR